ncbi:unnamed protein product [Urochloa humidicola]
MMIQVHDVSNNIARGWLQRYDLELGIAFVKVTDFLDVCVVHLRHGMEFPPHGDLVAIQLVDSDALTHLMLSKDSSASEDGKVLGSSKAGDGAPLFDGDGNFVGMNLLLDTGRRSYVRTSVIIEQLEQFEKINKLRVSERANRFRPKFVYNREEPRRNGKHYSRDPKAIELTAQDPLEDVDYFGYPKKPETAMEGDMVLVNTFEEAFGDSFDSGEGVWSILSKTVGENLSRSVVSLASYNGSMRFFACSGVIIEWKGCSTILTSASLVRNRFDEKKIEENLKIDVLLTNNLHTEGTLEHYNLHYNVAIVSFKGFGNHSTVNIHDRGARRSSKVAAVGRCFQSSMLMAAGGMCTGWQSRFDCDDIQYSSCEITKAGIGGPLVDFEGKFVGMNFYDWKEGTPFLPQVMIVLILAHFEKKRIVDVVDKYGYTNRWPVPKPLWRCSNEHHPENEEKEEFTVHVPGSSMRRYGHFLGELICLI